MRTGTSARAGRLAAAALAAALAVPGMALAHGTAAGSGRHHAAAVRSYDHGLLTRTNKTRTAHDRKHYGMNHRLWKIAHAYAKHLAKTGTLVHNPDLDKQITKACPRWTNIGENIGQASGTNPEDLFQAYMHSPTHRANLLDKSFTQVGIASVQVTRNGVTTQYNVIDFANHCAK